MVSNKEILCQALESYACNTVEKLFGLSSLPTQTLVKYGIRNMMDKYGDILDFFTDKEGNINVPLLMEAGMSELKARGGFTVWNIKFTDKDLSEILDIWKELSTANNGKA